MRHSQIIMGTGVSLDIPNAPEKVFEDAFERLRQIDKKFSSYKKNSELSKYNHAELKEPDLSREMKFIIHACRRWEERTAGFFNAWYDEKFDPSGYVKGWAVAEAAKVIQTQGFKTYCVYIGGDILARSDGSKVWKIAIQDPTDKSKILNKLSISNGAIATSGNSERGQHIINPKTGRPADELASITVFGSDIVVADILATACFAAGREWPKVLAEHRGYEALVLEKNGTLACSAGFKKNLNRSRENSLT